MKHRTIYDELLAVLVAGSVLLVPGRSAGVHLLWHALTFEVEIAKDWTATVTITNRGDRDLVLSDGGTFFELREKKSARLFRIVGPIRPFGVHFDKTFNVPGNGGAVRRTYDLKKWRIAGPAPDILEGFECRYRSLPSEWPPKQTADNNVFEGLFAGEWGECPALVILPEMRLVVPQASSKSKLEKGG